MMLPPPAPPTFIAAVLFSGSCSFLPLKVSSASLLVTQEEAG